jgi:hypothetical protein
VDTNPFQSPQLPSPPDPQQPDFDPRQIGLARQVPIVAVLMIVNGVLLSIAGIGLLGFTLLFGNKFVDEFQQQQQANPNGPRLNPESLQWIFQGMFGVFGSVVLLAGLLGIFAGIRNYSFRGRVLGIIAMVGGMASIFICWCIPFSIALLIYGLIIYLSSDAEIAFRWQETKAQRGIT